jgi:hypothetical protein
VPDEPQRDSGTESAADETDESVDSGSDVPEAENLINKGFWHVPETQKTDVPEIGDGDVPETEIANVPEVRPGWRIEVTNGGIYWIWRRGSHANRDSNRGGRFGTLSQERQEQYEQNKRIEHNRKEQAKGRRAKSG